MSRTDRRLGTIARNQCRPRIEGTPEFEKMTRPTPLQRRALELLGVKLGV